MFRPPGPSRSEAGIEAVRAGQSRIVSCFLRGISAPYPVKLTHGVLTLSARAAD
jgi:hypothetical protein